MHASFKCLFLSYFFDALPIPLSTLPACPKTTSKARLHLKRDVEAPEPAARPTSRIHRTSYLWRLLLSVSDLYFQLRLGSARLATG
jgi:hypothetical protein